MKEKDFYKRILMSNNIFKGISQFLSYANYMRLFINLQYNSRLKLEYVTI